MGTGLASRWEARRVGERWGEEFRVRRRKRLKR